MTPDSPQDLSQFSMLDLFRLEAENQTSLLARGLLELESGPDTAEQLEVLMRAAHSLKGAARMVEIEVAVRIAHAMEDRFVLAQQTGEKPSQAQIDTLLLGVDMLSAISRAPAPAILTWYQDHAGEVDAFFEKLAAAEPPATSPGSAQPQSHTLPEETQPSEPRAAPPRDTTVLQEAEVEPARTGEVPGQEPEAAAPAPETETAPAPETETAPAPETELEPEPPAPIKASGEARQSVRVTADNLSRLLGLAGESLVSARWLDGFATDLLRLKRARQAAEASLGGLRMALGEESTSKQVSAQLEELHGREELAQELLARCLAEMDAFNRRYTNLAQRLHQEVLDCRMRPFADGVVGFPRMVRDLARSLGKDVKLELSGENTPVDRDILEQMESPLGHLLRNALDHGIETPAQRLATGKPVVGTVKLAARHSAGMLLITVTDDGRGIDTEAVREAVVRKKLASAEVASRLSTAELLEFLFLPGFTLTHTVTDISGRGVGLDVVQDKTKKVGGLVRVTTRPGQGTHFHIQLPLTLSVVRTLLVEIDGEPYAFPLHRILSARRLDRSEVQSVEGRQYFSLGERQVGLVTARQLLEMPESSEPGAELSVLILGDATQQYGLVVDRFLGEKELIVRALDPRLGKVQDVSAAAQMPDQTPVLLIDVDDMLRSIENLVSGHRLVRLTATSGTAEPERTKRVLVVDDSLTVRELERKLIESRGYLVDVAVDGVDGWNAVRTGHYDLVVTDVDMPRMDGIELVTLIKKEVRLQSIPVMIVSYKDRPADRQRGLDAGADYYLTKGSFQDDALVQAIADLIGEPQS